MDRLKTLEIFKAVVDRGSFTRAADALDLSNSVTSRAVRDLESALGVRLLQRSTRSISLTPEGEGVLNQANVLLEAYRELVAIGRFGAAEAAGDIRVSAPVFLGASHLSPILAGFMAKHPRIRLDLQLTDTPVNLVEDSVDLAVWVAGDLPDSLVARQVGQVAIGVYASATYLQRHKKPVHPSELAEHDWLTYNGAGRASQWRFFHPMSGARFDLPAKGTLSSNNGEALVAAAMLGSGLVLLPTLLAEDAIARGELERVIPEWQTESLGVYLAYSSRRNLSRRVRLLIEYMADALPASLEDVRRTASGGMTSENARRIVPGASNQRSGPSAARLCIGSVS